MWLSRKWMHPGLQLYIKIICEMPLIIRSRNDITANILNYIQHIGDQVVRSFYETDCRIVFTPYSWHVFFHLSLPSIFKAIQAKRKAKIHNRAMILHCNAPNLLTILKVFNTSCRLRSSGVMLSRMPNSFTCEFHNTKKGRKPAGNSNSNAQSQTDQIIWSGFNLNLRINKTKLIHIRKYRNSLRFYPV